MSTGLYVYSVNLADLRAVPGSRDGALVEAIVATDADWLESIDAVLRECVEDEVLPRFLPSAEAIRQIVHGEPLDEELGVTYAHAYERICRRLASAVAGEWSSISGSYDFFEKLDVELDRQGATIRLHSLTGAGPVFPLPRPDDFPALGWWSPEAIAASLPRLGKSKRSFWRLFGRKTDDATEDELADSLRDIRKWLTVAARHSGDCLVGVHHY